MASIVFPCQTSWSPQIMRTQLMRAQERRERRRLSSAPSRRQSMIKNLQKVCTFTYNTSGNVPLHHHFPGAPASWFEEYMEDMGRVVGAIIPEKSSAVRMNQEEWRIKMPVVEALFLKVQPMIDVRVTAKSSGQDYPPHVPPNVSKLYHVHTTKWKLQGLHSGYVPPFFNLEASGTLYPLTRGTRGCVIKNQLSANVTIVFPPLLSWVPQHVLDSIMLSIIKTIVEDIRKGCTVRLLADYRSFQRSKFKNLK